MANLKLLYVCEADSGGITEYAIRQSAALVNQGVEVHFFCKDTFPHRRLSAGIRVIHFEAGREPFWSIGKLRTIWRLTIGSHWISQQIAKILEKNHLEFVLFACFKEYFSPFWVWPLRRLARNGVVIGTIAHDPVRDFVVGPLWWHRWSVRLGYSFVRHVFVHDDTPVDFGGRQPERIQVHQIPHGPYEISPPKIGRIEMRRRLGFDSGLTSTTGKKLTTEFTTEHRVRCEMEQPKGESVGTIESKRTEKEQSKDGSEVEKAGVGESKGVEAGLRLAGQAGVAFLNPSTSELARDSENTSLPLPPAPSLDCGQKTSGAPEALSLDARRSPLDSLASPDVVFLAFGQIRDGKNLDLFLRAMTQLPENVKLLVTGNGDSGSSKPPEFYQKLAEELGLADRCRWDIRRIPEDEVGDIFAASDVVLVTYSAKFRSASGVLNVAVSARKPMLASSGPGPLNNVVRKYHLGLFVEPDNPEDILRGAMQLLDLLAPPSTSDSLPVTTGVLLPAWDRYESDNSWKENATTVMNLISSSNGKSLKNHIKFH